MGPQRGTRRLIKLVSSSSRAISGPPGNGQGQMSVKMKHLCTNQSTGRPGPHTQAGTSDMCLTIRFKIKKLKCIPRWSS